MPRQAARLSLTQKLALNTQLATSIRVLRFDASGLTRYLEEQAANNPAITLTRPAPESLPWLPRWTTAFAAQGMGGPNAPDIGALLQSPALGLIAHVIAQIDQIIHTPRDRAIAQHLVHALEPSGWLGRPLAPLAAEAGCSLPEAEQVLVLLQKIEPTGLFARTLAECLRLQAVEAEVLDPVLECILAHLDLLAEGQFARLAKLCGVEEADILNRLRLIRSFDPKPGTQFGQVAAPVREPDLMVTRGTSGWQISLNRSSLPEMAIAQPGQDGPDLGKGELTQARDLARMVSRRNQTLLAIGQEILTRQEAVLAQGLEALKPMGLQEIAAALSLHASTVSRAVAGVSVDTPRGTIWLRALFTESLDGKQGEAAGAIRARLQRLIREENPDKPLSDFALAEALSKIGSAVHAGSLSQAGAIARRTIAKYRALMDIPPAHRRKRRV
jgi:RNA polymerase sigma-54 factor